MTLVPLLLAIQADPARPVPAPAPQKQGETLVSARKVDEPLADYPGSATVIGAEEIDAYQLQSPTDAGRRVPELYFSEFTSRRLAFPFVRGVGSGTNDPAVITYIDDVPQFGFGGTNLPLFELERIEFLRGPQGTLYGKNALGGLIHVHSARPGDAPEYGASVGVGSYHELDVSGTYSGPLTGGVGLNAGVLSTQRDGYTVNDFTGNDVDDREAFFGRGSLLFEPTQDSELALGVFGERSRDGGFALSELEGLRDRPHRINQDFEGLSDRDVLSPSAVYRTRGSDYDFTSVSAYQHWDVLETSDFDFSPIDGVRRRTEEDQGYFYQELRIGTPAAEDWHLNEWRDVRWLVGLSGYVSDASRESANIFRPGGEGIFFPVGTAGTDTTSGDFDDMGLALFGEGTLVYESGLELTAGLRADVEDKELDRARTFEQGGVVVPTDGGSEDDTFGQLSPRFAVAYHVDDDTLTYVSASQGWKAGGFNLAAPNGQIDFDSETSWSYELGVRHSFPEQRAQVSASVFLVDWEDMQLSLFDPVAGGFIDNAGESRSQGLELEGQAVLVENLQGYASLGWMSSEIDDFTDNFGTDTSGNELPFAPENTLALGLQYGGEMPFELGVVEEARWFVGGDVNYVGEYFYDPGNRESDQYSLVNFQAGLASRLVSLTFWLRNAFDEEYFPVAFQPSPLDADTFVAESGAPRVLGCTLSLHL